MAAFIFSSSVIMSVSKMSKQSYGVGAEPVLKLPCSLCEKVYKNSQYLVEHHRNEHARKYSVFECQMCSCRVLPFRLVEIRRHMRIFHLGFNPKDDYLGNLKVTVKPNYTKLIKCGQCEFTHTDRKVINDHVHLTPYLKRKVDESSSKPAKCSTAVRAEPKLDTQLDFSQQFTLTPLGGTPMTVFITPVNNVCRCAAAMASSSSSVVQPVLEPVASAAAASPKKSPAPEPALPDDLAEVADMVIDEADILADTSPSMLNFDI